MTTSARLKLLIVNPRPFGYAAGYYYYCQYLRRDFDITFLTCEHPFPRVELDGIQIVYVKPGFRTYIRAACREIGSGKYDRILMTYTRYAAWIALREIRFRKRMVLDIRSGNITGSPLVNRFWNLLIWGTSLLFPRVTILSESLRMKLHIGRRKTTLLSLGGQWQASERKYDSLHLLYVGTLRHRDVFKSVEGVALYQRRHPECTTLAYDIFGDGSEEDVRQLQEAMAETAPGTVRWHRRKPHAEIADYFRTCTVGVSFIPMLPCFEAQPPTKTFEYVLAGLYCIGTATGENRQLLSPQNGVLCMDTAESFADALEQCAAALPQLRAEEIAATLKDFTWENITRRVLLPLLSKV